MALHSSALSGLPRLRRSHSEGRGSLLAPEPIRIWEARSYDLNLWTERKRIEKLVFYPRLQ